MVRTIIVDDEPLAIELLKNYALQSKQLQVVATFTNPVEAMEMIGTENVDLVFLDIEMELLNGIELANQLKSQKVAFIFTTAFREFAVEAFDLKAVDYLLKPIRYARFFEAIERIPSSNLNKIVLRSNRKDYYLHPEEILYVKGVKDYVQVVLKEESLYVKGSLGHFVQRPEMSFLKRVHRSYAINPTLVTSKSVDYFHIGSIPIPIGASYKN